MIYQGIGKQIVNFFKIKKNLLRMLLIFVILILSVIVLIISNNLNSLQDKSWELNLTYNSNTEKLSLEKLNVIDRKMIPDERQALFSPYKLEVLDNQGSVLFQNKINITEQILFSVLKDATDSAIPLPIELKSIIYVPGSKEAVKIIILRQNLIVLQINLSKNISYSFVKKTEAAVQNISCGPMQVVFINNNYKDVKKFQKDVTFLKNLYKNISPYIDNPDIFDFQEIDDPQSFGCEISGILKCIINNGINMKKIGLNIFPNAQKFIVLVDNPNARKIDQGLAGVVNGVGGSVIIFTNYKYNNTSFIAAVHEFEGHAVGWLFDRYVSSDANYSNIKKGYAMSNCSTNQNGENTWPGVFQGCGNINQYAPSSPGTCIANTKKLISGGPIDTIMSAAGCTNINEFDQTERDWIENNIVSNYKPCSGYSTAPTLTSVPVPTRIQITTPTSTPVPTSTVNSFPILNYVIPTPIPTSIPAQTYSCIMDPSCSLVKNSIQMCPLKCTPN